MSGLNGAVPGTVVASVIRRMGIPGLIAAGVGGYLLKKRADKRAAKAERAEKAAAVTRKVTPAKAATKPVATKVPAASKKMPAPQPA